jgi:exonuclease SbcC
MEGALQGLEQALSRLDGQAQALGYDEGAHLEAQQRLKGVEPFESERQRLLEAEKHAPAEAQALESAREKQARLEAKRLTALSEKAATASDLASQPQLKLDISLTDADYVQLRAEGDRMREAVGRVRGRLEDLNRLEADKGVKAAERRSAGEEEGIYSELAEAFGPKGAPALIIERALPELEEDANALLARMTQGRLTLRFETQEATKRGGVVETLDIAVADERGTRSYAMFSGGEAFRINLALRIALAKFLARRAGAPLPILVVDEGFGSQDAEGRERLVEAINSIAPDFEKVILVTHIEELKEMFPVRLEVTRGPGGSRVSLST